MATQAIMIGTNGERRLVYAKDLTAENRKNSFFCTGITPQGELCGCPVKPSQPTPLHGSYFYASDSNARHKPGCSNCKKRKTTDVERLDQSGVGITIEALFERLNRETITVSEPEKGDPPMGRDGDDVGDHTIDISAEDNGEAENQKDDEKEIRIKPRHPRAFIEYKDLLTRLSEKDTYANRLVYDQILDERTVAGYRRFGVIPTGRPFIITARKTIPREYGIQLTNGQWLLKDFWGRGGNEFLFIVNVNEEAKQLLWNLSNITPAVKIVIWAVFHRCPTRPKTYISERVKPDMILYEVVDDIS